MPERQRFLPTNIPAVAGSVLAIGAVGVALLVRLVIAPDVFAKANYLPFFFAIAVTGVVAGMRAGLLATGLSVAAVAWAVHPPTPSMNVESGSDRFQLLLFAIMAVGLCWMAGSLHDSRRRLRRGRSRLRENEERFRIAAEAVNGIIYEYDLRSGHVKRMRGLYEVAGFRPEEVPPTVDWWQDRMHPDDRRAARERSERAGPSRTVASEYRVRHADGRWIHLEDRAVVISGDDGRPAKLVGCAVDVTAQKAQEAALRQERDRLNFVVETCGIGLWLNPLPLGQLEWSAHVKEHFHLPPDAPAPTVEEFYALIHPEDRDWVRGAVTAAVETGSLFDVEYRTVSRDTGAIKWIRAVGKAIYGPGGEPVHFDGITRDVTTRRLAEDRLRQSEQHLRLLSNTVPALISYIGPDGRYRACNDAYTAWFGLPREQIVGRHMREVLGEAAWQKVGGYYEQALAGQPIDYETEVNYRHAGSRWIHAVYTPHLNAQGGVEGLIVLVTDVSAYKRAEEAIRRRSQQFETLVHAAPLGIYLVDAGFRILQVNPVAAPHFAAVAGGAIGRDLAEVMRAIWEPADAEAFIAIFRHGLQTGASYVNPEYAARRLGRSAPDHYEWRLDRITLPDGGHGLVCYFRDISAQVQARTALQEADRRKDEFLATLAHELRNPLAPLRNGLQVLKLARPGDAAADDARAMMERQLGHMVRLIDDLMDVSRISRGKVELRRERVELAKLVQQAVETSRPLLEADGHELVVRIPDEPIYVDADVTRMAQVFANLLNNAAKYTEPGGRVTLSVAREDGAAVVAVRDTGVGIPARMLPRVFDLFTQVDRSLEKRQGGLGIGLSLVKRLVELHGGTVEALSDGPGHGSEFRVRLPLVLALAATPEAASHAPAAAPGRRRVLVVDDNRDAALSLAMLLRLLGNETRAAHDGIEALDIAASFRPDVVILDIGMPRLNGYETCRRLRERPGGRSVVLVALTGWGADEDRERSRDAGFDAHLVKPVDPEALEELFARLNASSA